ncbi:YhhN-like protein [Leptospira ryugenii]|uniref:YhhN-like protein n=1 Tax=Leptospira ryugenii TaxID=1917863 RepID=A0A2P2E3X8_9LEPT|nr:lysoplasmalogenase family protein [Leptospira ryugenii]GBF51595.1 YhhN-like protein [Leptospira ryugenii]
MSYYAVLVCIPLSICVAFLIHWYTLRPIQNSKNRLEVSRGTYLGFSIQILLFAFLLFYLGGSVFLAPVFAIIFSFLGDWFNLQFPIALKNNGEPLIGGIVSFAMAQLFYISAFFQILPWSMLYSGIVPYLLSLSFLILTGVIFYFRVYEPKRSKPIMISALIYGLLLSFFVSLTANAYIQFGGVWLFLLLGGLFFIASDAIMGETTINGTRHPVWEYQVPWITYLLAQGLLLIGFFLVSHTKMVH